MFVLKLHFYFGRRRGSAIFLLCAQQDTIRENTVEGFSSAQANGILAIGARSSVFACNTVKDVNYGLELRDECTSTDINTNLFQPPLGVGVSYPNGTLVGSQVRRGNQWFGNTKLEILPLVYEEVLKETEEEITRRCGELFEYYARGLQA